MVRYACTPGTPSVEMCCKLLRRVTSLTLLLFLSGSLISAQDAKTRRESGTARLEITARVVPAAICLPPPVRHRFDEPVSYDVPAGQMELSVVERVRPLDANTVLKTVTVVPK
jgi:hypothetical protein